MHGIPLLGNSCNNAADFSNRGKGDPVTEVSSLKSWAFINEDFRWDHHYKTLFC